MGNVGWHMQGDAPEHDELQISLTRPQYIHIAMKHGFRPLPLEVQRRINDRPGIRVQYVNRDAVKQTLRQANRHASENVLTCYCDIEHLTASFEARLDELHVPDTERDGILVRWRRPGPSKAYRAMMNVSDVQLLREGGAWFLHEYSRATVAPETLGIQKIQVEPSRLAMFGAFLHPSFVPASEEATDV